MAQTIYTRVLPNLTRATRAKAYEGLSLLLSHLDPMERGIDLLSVSIDVPTRTITVVLTNPLTDDELDHFGML